MDNIKTWTGLPMEESIRMTEKTGINGESTSTVWPTLGSRTAKEQKTWRRNLRWKTGTRQYFNAEPTREEGVTRGLLADPSRPHRPIIPCSRVVTSPVSWTGGNRLFVFVLTSVIFGPERVVGQSRVFVGV